MTIAPIGARDTIGQARTSAARRARMIGPINSAIRIAMMAMTTSSSTSVKPQNRRFPLIPHPAVGYRALRKTWLELSLFCQAAGHLSTAAKSPEARRRFPSHFVAVGGTGLRELRQLQIG